MLMRISAFLFFAIILGAEGQSCPAGFKLVNQNKCLRIFTNKLKHLEAETDCSYLGGTLVTVKSAVDNKAITSFAASTGANSAWLGMFCFVTGNSTTCYHDDNTGTLTYNNFAAGNPAVAGNGGCVYMQVTGKSAGQWISAPCEVVGMPFICEVPMTNADSSCAHNYNGYCYMASHEMNLATVNTTYDRAQAICLSNNANLVSLHSKPEIDYVKSIYRNTGVQQIFAGAKAFLPDTFEWSDGSNWDYDYTDPLATSKGNCLVMDLSSRPNNGMWSETNCQNINYFLCKRKAGSTSGTVMPEVAEKKKGVKDTVNPRFSRTLKSKDCFFRTQSGASKSDRFEVTVARNERNELLDFSNCNATIVMSPGTITNFGYPNSHPPMTKCTWNLAALGPYRIGIYFTDFSTYGNVYVYDEFGNLITSPNGNYRPFQVLGATNVVRITHDSTYDAVYNYHGFSATILPY